ncbi:hypothetical protein [Pseudomonas putida]|uniref:hypothetical protein n=1 Tax=Pseudomonas putida TaxID=303 RepID=UPI0015751CEC|nr:hypothetical protein [Pseudomonas putida]NTY90361.1 hypothetical protein [Pseudomonas putida]NTY98903.1 hypothetical protein [Pseudomonas putida]NTZ21186.1 hypothetical protein [Pseudomonas putida]NTZ53295.1 hypothetical protein [Pseudomonas putida]NTZ65055.1 hypothetical protein [Pseudomonas putida]
MSEVTKVVRTAADLHRYLIDNKNFDFNPDHERDGALYLELKKALGLPEAKFLAALDGSDVTAEQYLRALMEISQPLSKMYEEIYRYCARANVLRSNKSAQIEWEIRLGEDQINFSLEAFRVFDKVKASVSPSYELMFDTKNDVMNWLAHDVFQPSHQGLDNRSYNWQGVELFKILKNARDRLGPEFSSIFKGLNNFYLGGGGPRVPSGTALCVTEHNDYAAKLSAVTSAFVHESIESVASEFIELPFWKFRWQIYEIWIVTVSLAQFERYGFQLNENQEGASLIELGRQATLATHHEKLGSFIYQPTYLNASGFEMRPDIVISHQPEAASADVPLVIECKQRLDLDVQHLESVRVKYEAGVCSANGQVVIVNYDDVRPWSISEESKTTLIGNVRPGSQGEVEFKRFLASTYIAKSLRKEVWFVDVSMSMHGLLNDEFRDLLNKYMSGFAPGNFTLYGFAMEVVAKHPSELYGDVAMSQSPADANWEGHGIKLLGAEVNKCLANKYNRLFVFSDIASRIKLDLSLDDFESGKISFIDPGQERVMSRFE